MSAGNINVVPPTTEMTDFIWYMALTLITLFCFMKTSRGRITSSTKFHVYPKSVQRIQAPVIMSRRCRIQ